MKTMVFLLVLVLFPSLAFSNPVLLDNVPAYDQGQNPWCTFVSEASVFGYYDLHGYPNLYNLSAPAIFQTANVWPDVLQMVQLAVNNESNAAYNFAANIMDFASTKGYQFQAVDVPADLNTLTQEINKGYPLILSTNGNDPIPFHSEPVFGYDVRSDGVYVAYYNNWATGEAPLWKLFNVSQIYDLITVEPIEQSNPISTPEPGTLILLGSALALLGGYLRLFDLSPRF